MLQKKNLLFNHRQLMIEQSSATKTEKSPIQLRHIHFLAAYFLPFVMSLDLTVKASALWACGFFCWLPHHATQTRRAVLSYRQDSVQCQTVCVRYVRLWAVDSAIESKKTDRVYFFVPGNGAYLRVWSQLGSVEFYGSASLSVSAPRARESCWGC